MTQIIRVNDTNYKSKQIFKVRNNDTNHEISQ